MAKCKECKDTGRIQEEGQAWESCPHYCEPKKPGAPNRVTLGTYDKVDYVKIDWVVGTVLPDAIREAIAQYGHGVDPYLIGKAAMKEFVRIMEEEHERED